MILAFRLNLATAGEKVCCANFFPGSGLVKPAVPQTFSAGRFAGRRDEISLNVSVITRIVREHESPVFLEQR